MALASNLFNALLETTITASVPGGPTPLWVPLVIIVLILLLLWWGLTRGRVYDENLPQGAHPVDHEEVGHAAEHH